MKWTTRVSREVAAAGGWTERSRDGHLKVFGKNGAFVVKVSAHGDDNGGTGRSVLRQVLRRVRGEQP